MKSKELISLFDLPLYQEGIVRVGVDPVSGQAAERALALRLFEIGFLDGERVRVVARGHPGGDPVAVRVGSTMFALRRFEAERVLVAPVNHDGKYQ